MLHLSGSSYITGEDTLQDDCDITAIFHHNKANTTSAQKTSKIVASHGVLGTSSKDGVWI